MALTGSFLPAMGPRLWIVASNGAIHQITWTPSQSGNGEQQDRLVIDLANGELPGDDDARLLRETSNQLMSYVAGELTAFDRPLHFDGTEFQKSVWEQLLAIPYGEVRTYGEIADRLGNSGAFRAVGAANGRNPIPIVVPCHRVIAANRTLGGFSAGLGLKRQLLHLEGVENLRYNEAFEGKRSREATSAQLAMHALQG
jgi:O-6-methylguanine DNA methyltransferase